MSDRYKNRLFLLVLLVCRLHRRLTGRVAADAGRIQKAVYPS